MAALISITGFPLSFRNLTTQGFIMPSHYDSTTLIVPPLPNLESKFLIPHPFDKRLQPLPLLLPLY
jgi:hypothetical protein